MGGAQAELHLGLLELFLAAVDIDVPAADPDRGAEAEESGEAMAQAKGDRGEVVVVAGGAVACVPIAVDVVDLDVHVALTVAGGGVDIGGAQALGVGQARGVEVFDQRPLEVFGGCQGDVPLGGDGGGGADDARQDLGELCVNAGGGVDAVEIQELVLRLLVPGDAGEAVDAGIGGVGDAVALGVGLDVGDDGIDVEDDDVGAGLVLQAGGGLIQGKVVGESEGRCRGRCCRRRRR